MIGEKEAFTEITEVTIACRPLDPKAIATFLYITREGTPGLLFVGVEVRDDGLKPSGRMEGDIERQPVAFRKGRRFGFNHFEEAQLEKLNER